jgi:hypothetical protein
MQPSEPARTSWERKRTILVQNCTKVVQPIGLYDLVAVQSLYTLLYKDCTSIVQGL